MKKTDLFGGRRKMMLHVAPEPFFESRLKERLGQGYLTADLLDPRAMVRMDITDIKYADRSFDVIFCCHVLEHIENDRQAMREFNRVLKNDGWAILLVPPITADKTYEDPAIVDPKARSIAFGQEDHVRRYGIDYVDRLCEAGFAVKIAKVSDLVEEDDAIRMGLTACSGEIYYCTK
jgi:predicted SAM-dependent methyltransferase